MKISAIAVGIILALAACTPSPESRLKGAWEEVREEPSSIPPATICFDGKDRLRVWMIDGWRPERKYKVLSVEGDRLLVDINYGSSMQAEFYWDLSDPDRAIVQLADLPFRDKKEWIRFGGFNTACEDGAIAPNPE